MSISRGSYCFQGGPLQLPKIEMKDNVVTATETAAKVSCEFADAQLKVTVTNFSAAPLLFLMVFDAGVKGIINGKGEGTDSGTRPILNWTRPAMCTPYEVAAALQKCMDKLDPPRARC